MLCTCMSGRKPCGVKGTQLIRIETQIREGYAVHSERVMCDEHAEQTLEGSRRSGSKISAQAIV
jgi:hypothetical protein